MRRVLATLVLAASAVPGGGAAASALCYRAPGATAHEAYSAARGGDGAREPSGMAGDEVPEGEKQHPKGFTATIPTWVHVIAAGPTLAEGNVPTSQVQQQVAVLNKSFAGGYDGAKTGFSFRLDGVTRTVNPEWHAMGYGSQTERRAKTALRRGGPDTLNLYLTDGGGLLGWATFPSHVQAQQGIDGVVVNFGSLPGGAIERFNLGFTATHEVGHWLGLYHTFQNGCSATGDQVTDTPPQRTPTRGCPEGKDTCTVDPGLDPIHNFMDYSDDPCYTEFTGGQTERMVEQYLHFRAP
jgi:hypothetical protein